MRLFRNRIVLSLLLILVGTSVWEFCVRPVTGPVFADAVNEYRHHNYAQSLKLLHRAYEIDPNDTTVLTLMGWDYLKMRKPDRALAIFSRAHRLAPHSSDTILGLADTEITLEHYQQASELLVLLGHEKQDSADVDMAWGSLYQLTGRNQQAAREFERVLVLRHNDALAMEDLRQLYSLTGGAAPVSFLRVDEWQIR